MVNSYISQYTYPEYNKYMAIVGQLNLRRVRKAIKLKYKNNRGLGYVNDQRRYQVFNMGHITESVDLSVTYSLLNQDERFNIDDLMFGQFLKRDNVIASRSGDNFLTNTSIKYGSASVYSYNTISNQLKQIQFMLNSKNPDFIRNKIEYLFLDKSDKSSLLKQDLELAANKAVNKILEQMPIS